MRHRTLFFAVTAPLLFACILPGGGGGGGFGDTFAGTLDTAIAACVPSDTPTLELGVGRNSWGPMPVVLQAESGSQGGQHVWLAFHATGLDLSSTSIVWITGEANGAPLIDQMARLAWTCKPNGVAEVFGLQVPLPTDAIEQYLALEVQVTDVSGRVVETSATVLID